MKNAYKILTVKSKEITSETKEYIMRVILKWILNKHGLPGSGQVLAAGTFVYEELSDSAKGGTYFNLLINKDYFLQFLVY